MEKQDYNFEDFNSLDDMLNPEYLMSAMTAMFDFIRKDTTNFEKKIETSKDGRIQLAPIELKEDYSKKWNNHQKDFVLLVIDGKPISNTLYRVGGFVVHLDNDYFILIKHVEAYYEDNITKVKKDKPHLEGRWCIINQDGKEMVEFEHFKTPNLIDNSVIYSLDSNYYNIETKELYCGSYNKVESEEFLFLQNDYDDDKTKRGVMKINKKDGSFELFKAKKR